MKYKIFFWAFFATISIEVFAQSNNDIATIKRNIQSQYVEMCVQLNKQTPIRVDEITSIKNVLFSNWTMTTYYSVAIDAKDYKDTELKDFMSTIKANKKRQIPSMISNGDYKFTQDELYEYLKGTGLRFRFIYHDTNNVQIGAISFDYNDFKPIRKCM